MPNGDTPAAPGGQAPSLEQRVSIFDSIGDSIDSLVGVVKAIPSVVKETAYYTYYTTKVGLGLAAGLAMGGYNALILPVGIVAGQLLADWKNKEKPTFKKLANEAAIGGILGGVLHYLFLGNAKVGEIVKKSYGVAASLATRALGALAQLPVFLGTHEYLNRALIKEYKPKPLSNMWKQIKGPMKWIIPPIIANFTVVPEYLGHAYQMPVAAGISTAYGLLKAEPKKKEEQPKPSQQDVQDYLQRQMRGAA